MFLTHCMLEDKIMSFKMVPASFFKMWIEKGIVLETNRLEPRSGPTYVGPDIGNSLFVVLQKY